MARGVSYSVSPAKQQFIFASVCLWRVFKRARLKSKSSLRRGLRNQHARVVRSPEEESNAIALAGACELNELFLGAMLVRLLCMDVRCRCY